MHSTFALAALAAVAYAAPHPQGVTEDISPEASAPAGCTVSYSGSFQIAAVKVTSASKRDIVSRSTCGTSGSLTLTLADGKLLDAQGRTGYIASNYQFQFDDPAQAGAIYTDGFSACSNSSLALGGSTVFYQCLSGEFYNLYDRNWASQCSPIALQILPCSASTSSASNGVGQVSDGQATGTAVGTAVTQISDGQVQVVTQIADGQIQGPTSLPVVTQISDGQVQGPTETVAPITQISDGQVQAPTTTAVVAPITQISDGQVQAPTSTAVVAPITQISDGQVQAPTATATVAPITQISDGQVQAPTASATVAPITQISDGQVQAPTGTGSAVVTNTTTTTSAVPFNGKASGLQAMTGTGFAVVLMGLVSVFLL